MNINRKLELVKAQIVSISTHEDEQLAVREAALAEVGRFAQAEADAAAARVAARVEAMALAPAETPAEG